MKMLTLHLLGTPELQAGTQRLRFRSRHSLALLIYLAVEGRSITRDHLAAVLWPDVEPQRSRGMLRYTLAWLRQTLACAPDIDPNAVLLCSQDRIAIQPNALRIDTRHLEQLAHALHAGELSLARLSAFAAEYRGDFLQGFELGEDTPFDEWALTIRERCHRQRSLLLEHLARTQQNNGRAQEAVATALTWTAHDPGNEAAYLQLMCALMQVGDRSGALRAYAQARAVLESQYGLTPSAELSELAAQIRVDARREETIQNASSSTVPSERAARHRLPFVGRSEEFQLLTRAFDEVRAGHPQICLITGLTGVGKTRLAQEFLAWARVRGADILQGQAYEIGAPFAYQALLDALQTRIAQERAPDDLLADVWLAELSRLLPELRDRYPDLALPPTDGDTADLRLCEAIFQLSLALAAQRPLVWLLDDAQWADPASRAAISYLVRRWSTLSMPVLLLISASPETFQQPQYHRSLAAWYGLLAQVLPLTHCPLGRLNRSASVELVRSIVGGDIPPAGLAELHERLHAITDGHPLSLVELLTTWRARRAAPMRTAHGEGGTGELDARLELPTRLRVVIQRQLALLSPPAHTLLKAIAALNEPCTLNRLLWVAELSEEHGLAALDELLAHGLVQEVAMDMRTIDEAGTAHHECEQQALPVIVSVAPLVCSSIGATLSATRREMLHQRAQRSERHLQLKQSLVPESAAHRDGPRVSGEATITSSQTPTAKARGLVPQPEGWTP